MTLQTALLGLLSLMVWIVTVLSASKLVGERRKILVFLINSYIEIALLKHAAKHPMQDFVLSHLGNAAHPDETFWVQSFICTKLHAMGVFPYELKTMCVTHVCYILVAHT